MTFDTATPATVTRFYGTVNYALDVIRTREIAFVHVSMLNDPFDPYCFFETDFEGKYPNLLRYVQQHHPKHMPWFRAQVTPQSWGKTVRDLRAHLDDYRKHTFILSTSAPLADTHPKGNLYMWGHYGNGHRGVAIEFRYQKARDVGYRISREGKQHTAERSRGVEQSRICGDISSHNC
jgi:hypothetical protein